MSTSFDLYGYSSTLGSGTAHELVCDGCPECAKADRHWENRGLNCCDMISLHMPDCPNHR